MNLREGGRSASAKCEGKDSHTAPVQCDVLKVGSGERCYLKLNRFYRLTCWKVADTQAARDSTRYH